MNSIRRVEWLCVFVLAIFYSTICYGQGYRSIPEGGAASSQAGSFRAQCDDPSAVTHNPAGLVQLKGNQFLFGTTFITMPTEYRTNITSEDRKYTPGFMPYFYYCTDFGKEKMRFGIGLSAPYAHITEWPRTQIKNWGFVPTPPVSTSIVPYYSEIETLNFNPVFAYKFSPEFSLGIGLNAYFGRLVTKNLFSLSSPLFPVSMVEGKMEVDGTGFAPNLGFLYRKDKYRIGFTYRGGFDIDYEGDFKFSSLLPEQDAKTTIEFPQIIGLGIAFFPKDNLKIETDAEWVEYSCLKKIPVKIGGTTVPQQKNWDDCLNISLGVEYKKSKKITLKGGIAYIPSPVPDSTFEPSTSDADGIMISLGSDITTNIGKIELAFTTVVFEERNIKEGKPYDGKYESDVYAFTIGYKKEF